MDQHFIQELEKIVGAGRLRRMEPMSRHTTFRVGGPADVFVSPAGDALARVIRLCRECGETFALIGNGSNLLVGDRGIRGLVIEIGQGQAEISVQGDRIFAGAGALLSKLADTAAEHGLGGMEFAAGIPGTLGGAVVMNAGAYGGEMKDITERVTVLDPAGEAHVRETSELAFGYRSSSIQESGEIVQEAVLHLTPRDTAQIRARMEEFRRLRSEKQPLGYPSAGSTFKRPEGHFAGKLIMEAGLRGYRVGGAQVSEKHCGFVVNCGGATAAEIRQLMEDVRREVERQFQVTLEPEVRMIGEF